MRPVQVVLLAVALALASPTAAQEKSSALDHPAIKDVLAMVEAALSEGVMSARVEKIDAFPELDGRELAVLKRKGVPDAVLLMMLEKAVPGGRAPATAPAAPAPDVEPPVKVPEDAGLIRVLVERPFKVTYYEVVVDGQAVHTEGRLWEGSVDAGGHLMRPRAVRGKGSILAYESPVAPGSYPAGVGFAVSVIEGDPSDEWSEYAGEHYVTRGIRATGDSLPGQAPVGNPGAVCEVRVGQVCEVVASFGKSSPSTLGGLPVYSVRYRVDVRSLP
jgi:hypothetical protein